MRWLWIGDSHLEAMRPRVRDLSAAAGIGGAVSARVGWSTGRWASDGGIPVLLGKYSPDAVVVVLGTNDDPVDRGNVRALLGLLDGHRVVWFGPFHSTERDREFATAVGPAYRSGAAVAAGLPFVPGNVHLTARGYEQLADRLVVAAREGLRSHTPAWAIVGGAIVVGWAVLAVFGRRHAATWETRWQ